MRIRNRHDVARAWATQAKAQGKAASMFYEGATIYSYGYHFAIARLTETPNGETVALFTTRDYSVTTSGHKSLVSMALYRAGITEFRVPVLDPRSITDHVTNWTAIMQRALESERKAKRARKYRDLHLADAARYQSEAGRYWRTFRADYDVPNVVVETSNAA